MGWGFAKQASRDVKDPAAQFKSLQGLRLLSLVAPNGAGGLFFEPRARKEVLHDKDAPDVKALLESLPQSSALESSTLDTHLSYFRSLGLSYGEVQPSPKTEQSPWYQALPRRCQQLVACVQKRWPATIGVDTSQSPVSYTHLTLPTMFEV